MKGVYINLDRCLQRRQSLLQRLAAVGLPVSQYGRFSALEPVDGPPGQLRGLASRGELGIWQSLVAVLELIAAEESEAVVHVLEDDADFPADVAGALAKLSRLMLVETALGKVDLVFLDYFLNRQLFAHVAETRARLGPEALQVVPASKAYMGCLSSFLIRPASARYLAGILARILTSGEPLQPVDIALRSLLNMGVIQGVLVVPPLGAPAWDSDEVSVVQTHADAAMRSSQRAHLLLRQLAAGMRSPFWCGQRLEELYGITNPLHEDSGVQEFLRYFDALRSRMPDF